MADEVKSIELTDDVKSEFASKFKLEDVENTEQKTAEELATEQAAIDAASEAAKTEAAKNKEGKKEGEGDEGEGDEPKTPIAALIKDYGYTVEDFKDVDITDDSIEGIKKFNSIRDNLVKTAAVKELFEADPDLQDLLDHKKQGLSIDSWKQKKQAETFNIEFKEEDIDEMSDFMTKVYVGKGINEKRAKILVEGLKDDNELYSESKKEAAEIKENINKNADARIKAEKAEIAANEEENKKVVAQVTSIIKEGNLDNVIIPEAERKDFGTFLLGDKLIEKHEKLTLKQRMLLDYIVYKDFKVKGLEKVIEKQAASPRVRLGATGGGSGEGGTDGKEWKFDELISHVKGKT